MAGRHGFKMKNIKWLQVYKIDFPRSLIFLKGSIMGAPLRELYIRDSFFHQNCNIGRLNHPTFIYDNQGIYAD